MYLPENQGSGLFKATDLEYGYYEDEPLIIYMDLKVGLDVIYEASIDPVTVDGVAVYTCPTGAVYHVDPNSDTMVIEQFERGQLFSSRYGAIMGLIDSEVADGIVDDDESVYHCGGDVTLDLGEYGLDIIAYQGRAFLPFSIVTVITFMDAYYAPVGWNGEAFYFQDAGSNVLGCQYRESAYSRAYYSGPNSKAKREEYFTDFNYDALMFHLDHFYGFLDERFAPFNEYLSQNYPELVDDLHSSDDLTYERAIEYLYEVIIGDGHTNARSATSTFGTGFYETTGESSERMVNMNQVFYDCYRRRMNADLPQNEVRFQGNTAILSFDGFSHAGVILTEENIPQYAKDNGDTFALFLLAMKQIQARGDIENVILDITLNGGGDTNAMIPMLGVFDRAFSVTQYNPLSKSYAELNYKIDTNFDGVYDENDGFQGQYNFYILTSNYSFSCGSYFPTIAKQNGIATIIGEQSAGGACAVQFGTTPDGRPFRLSSISRQGAPEDPAAHGDEGCPVDYELDRDHFYDDAYLNNYVNSLAKQEA